MTFSFDPHIETAETLPARLYTDPAVLELEKSRIFARTWQLVGRRDHVTATGDFFTAEIAGEAIVVAREGDRLRAFHNVCLHRGGPVAARCGSRRSLQCRYHGWTYSLGGRLLRAPEMEGVAGFSPEEMRLREVRVESWGPLVFANLDPAAPPLATWLADVMARTAGLGVDGMRHLARRDYVIACNWKIYVDNYLEAYHVPMVHPGLYAELDYDRYSVETGRYSSRQVAPLRRLEDGGARTRRYVGDESMEYFWVFPNLMLNVYFGQMQTNLVVPLAQDRTLTVFEWYAARPPAGDEELERWEELTAFSDEIQVEDIAICEALQKNLRSRAYERGRYSVRRENGVHHFHGLLHEFLTKD
jgi:choline monooxygenase